MGPCVVHRPLNSSDDAGTATVPLAAKHLHGNDRRTGGDAVLVAARCRGTVGAMAVARVGGLANDALVDPIVVGAGVGAAFGRPAGQSAREATGGVLKVDVVRADSLRGVADDASGSVR